MLEFSKEIFAEADSLLFDGSTGGEDERELQENWLEFELFLEVDSDDHVKDSATVVSYLDFTSFLTRDFGSFGGCIF